MTISNSVDAGALQEIIDRLMTKEEQRIAIQEDIREIMKEAASTGFEPHAIKTIVRKQLMDDRQRARAKMKAETLAIYENAIQIDLPF
jgi:uncharacterized protein (UPF0335 family)